jgi:LDH2 family malate/lactate/ureidoglycolate dehydrogenase
MDDVSRLARTLGIAAASIRHANHYGIAGWYAMRASARGLIGLTMTNTSPLVAPTRGRTKLLGTNPLAFAAPAGRFGTLVLDMATSTITWGRLLVAARRGQPMERGVAIDAAGEPTTLPDHALRGGALLPLGGPEETGGYKGYGLSLMVDVLTGVLAAANFGSRVVPFSLTDGPSGLGQLFLAIDPESLAPGFEARMETLLDELVTAPTAPGALGRVLIPGEPETRREEEQRERGVIIDPVHHASLVELGERIGVAFPAVRVDGAVDGDATGPPRPTEVPLGALARRPRDAGPDR